MGSRSGEETIRTGRELGKRKGQRTASLSHLRSHRAPVSLKERAKRPNRETPAPRCHSGTELETRVLKPQVEKYNPGRFWKQFWKSWFTSKSSGTRELLQKIMVLKLFRT